MEMVREFAPFLISLWNLLFGLWLYRLIFNDNPARYVRMDIRGWKSGLKGDWSLGFDEMPKPERPKRGAERKFNPDDYWDEGEEYGTVDSNSGPSIRHPKNADRAYSGSVERFHDGGR